MITRDTDLSGLAVILDGAALSKYLSHHCPGWAPGPLRKNYVRYKPQAHCVVKYDCDNGHSGTFLYARAYGPQAVHRLHKLRSDMARRDEATSHCWMDGGQDLAVHLFPSAGRLKAFYRLAEPRRRRRLLAQLLPELPQVSPVTSLSYKPEKRYVCRVGDDSAGAVIKFYTTDGYRRARAHIEYLREIDVVYSPVLIGAHERHRALAFTWSAGRHLRAHVASGGDPAPSSLAGSLLADLHRRPVSDALPLWRPADEMERIEQLCRTIVFLSPALAPKVSELREKLTAALACIAFTPRLIHGDFYSKQVLVQEHGVRFLDFDALSEGPAAACSWRITFATSRVASTRGPPDAGYRAIP